MENIEYTNSLNRDLKFQHLDEELSDLEEKYTGENGRLFAAVTDEDEVIGCIAFHRHNAVRCEMKRLYVKPEYRKAQTGQKLIETLIDQARKDGYREIVLDTIKPFQSAIHLYQKYGFEEILPYYDNPMDDVIYMRLTL